MHNTFLYEIQTLTEYQASLGFKVGQIIHGSPRMFGEFELIVEPITQYPFKPNDLKLIF